MGLDRSFAPIICL